MNEKENSKKEKKKQLWKEKSKMRILNKESGEKLKPEEKKIL